MSKVGGGGGGPPKPVPHNDTPTAHQKVDLKSKEGVQKFKQTAQGVDKKVVDSFQRGGPQIEGKLAKLSTKAGVKLNFTNTDLAVLAQTFAHILKQNANADRKKRAKLFARAIIKKRKFGKIFENCEEEDLEEMFDIIAGQLDSSPVFAQLVDEVTEGARKMNG